MHAEAFCETHRSLPKLSQLLTERGLRLMRTLIYKRTHIGDPDESGCFGIYCCMGSVRGWQYDAVIGVGGVGREPTSCGIAEKITWIGIRPTEIGTAEDGYPLIVFERFRLLDENGPDFRDKAPKIANRLFSRHGARRLIVESQESAEIRRVLAMAKDSPPSSVAYQSQPRCKRTKCGKRRPSDF